MPKRRVDVTDYDRERDGRGEHVREYTRMQDVRGDPPEPSMEPLRRRTRTGDPAVTTSTDFNDFEITGKIVESGVPFPNDPDDKMLHNHYRITVRNLALGRSRSFDWYGSANDYQLGKEELERNDLLEAFRGFLEEAQMGGYSFEDFVSEFGYDEDSRRAERMWRGVQGQQRKAEALGLDDEDAVVMVINDLAHALGED